MIDKTELTGSFEYFFTGAHWINADPRNNDFKTDELYGVISGVLKMEGQNVVNNTYVENVTINNGGYQSSNSSAPRTSTSSQSSHNSNSTPSYYNTGTSKNTVVKSSKSEKKGNTLSIILIVVGVIFAFDVPFIGIPCLAIGIVKLIRNKNK